MSAAILDAAMDDPDRWRLPAQSVCAFLFLLAVEARVPAAGAAQPSAQLWAEQIDPLLWPPADRRGSTGSSLPAGGAPCAQVEAPADLIQKCAAVAEAALDGRRPSIPAGRDAARYLGLLCAAATEGHDADVRALREVRHRITKLPWPPPVTRDA